MSRREPLLVIKVKAITTLTESGSTALWMSRLNCRVPIYALTSQTATRCRCAREPIGKPGGASIMKIVKVGDHRRL